MMPMLRFFRHADGNFALFNGMGPTPVDMLATALAYDDARGAPVANAPHSGYQRIDAGKTALVMDTGKPPPLALSQEAHAGCLSFELSWNLNRLVVNCGMPAVNKESWRQVARATPAHSTVTFNDTSSCRFFESRSFSRLLFGTPDRQRAARPCACCAKIRSKARSCASRTTATRANSASPITACCGCAPTAARSTARTVSFTRRTTARRGRPTNSPSVSICIRRSRPSRLSDGHGAILLLPDRELWTFNTYGETADIEESVFLSGPDGPRRTVQIVIYGQARKQPQVRWCFRHTPPAGIGPRKDAPDEPELPL